MDDKVMELINAEINRLQVRGRKKVRERQYVIERDRLCAKFPGHKEHEYICKAVARKYRL